MNIVDNIPALVASKDWNTLGEMLAQFMSENGGHPYRGWKMPVSGWERCRNTPRQLLVALMGDGIYEYSLEAMHIRHVDSGIEILWWVCGDVILMFHRPGENGFTISNSKNGVGDYWRLETLDDPRNDPNYDPWEGSGSSSELPRDILH